MEKQIKLDEETHKRLSMLKYEWKLKTHNETIVWLLDQRAQ